MKYDCMIEGPVILFRHVDKYFHVSCQNRQTHWERYTRRDREGGREVGREVAGRFFYCPSYTCSFLFLFSFVFYANFASWGVTNRSQGVEGSLRQSKSDWRSIKVLHGNNLCRVITGLLAMVVATFLSFPFHCGLVIFYYVGNSFFFFSLFFFFQVCTETWNIIYECLHANKGIIGSSSS